MSSQSLRNPKDLRNMVSESSSDMEDMQKNLMKLKQLTEDDKMENTKLRSRIDEQCQLIMILKQRADEGTIRCQTLEKINKELLDFREQAEAMLKSEIKKYDVLDTRFNQLASNHEEMIQIKDEYKRANQELREDNTRLKDENGRLFSKTIAEKDNKIQELEKKCSTMSEQIVTLEQKLRQNQVEWRAKEEAMRQELSEHQTISSQQVKNLQSLLKTTEDKFKDTEQRLQSIMDKKRNMQDEVSDKLMKANKEKEELLALVMQRGKLIQKEQEENKDLKNKIEEMKKAVKKMEDRFNREAEAVNTNLKVKRLAEELEGADSKYTQMMKEYEAFKKHSSELLLREKELNDRLRHLYS
ncbi:coiled-coil domain-containing protein 89-like isoform X1 [Biomphalaria glabrata]|nr:coiled-coil domain-containing protein 89-like isoform X2 [Biomphalaria glabrata]XP_055880675.1 coiled-coil domain-containing protein 89-like isoform X2 [Biomphalaria glabrata]XP_055880682.1 coiled-coil domain-containing protein 89-like isoform X2 [Biomphalaria glabrata]XP_055880690.1 coiled-coil domain-containing protein 89-like isoform X2 [Biomphalaria glabrata]XP_055880696.1 coiled-coil domain-containing protein 89-like isoform X2 [Biomphalaria glabrata]KAI8755652.1 coiled-coil domain-con